MNAIEKFNSKQMKENVPAFEVGDTVAVSVNIKEGAKEYVITDLGREVLQSELQRLEELVNNGKYVLGGER